MQSRAAWRGYMVVAAVMAALIASTSADADSGTAGGEVEAVGEGVAPQGSCNADNRLDCEE